MNRFPVWKYALIGIVILLAFVYTVPNFFGESPAVQVTSAKSTVKVDTALMSRVEEILKKANIPYTGAQVDATGVRVRLPDADTQIRAKDILERALNTDSADPTYVVALNLLPASPRWLTAINALPMYLGLDLRGGVHFLLQIDMQAAVTKRIENLAADVRGQLREKNVRHGGVTREGQTIRVRFRDAATRDAARAAISANIPDLAVSERDDGQDLLLVATLKPEVHKRVQESAVQQNIGTLHKRVNELGVAEPVIQQQGADRIVVQLPGVQDIARAKEILGRTATLEVRLVDEQAMASGQTIGTDVFPERRRDGTVGQVPTKRQVIVTGDQFIGAQATFDQDNRPAVAVELDQAGGRAMRATTRENLKRLMAIILFEKGKGEAISVATIQGEFGSRFQITGSFTPAETNNLALLIRAGALAAPMEIIEERTIGPSLGRDNIEKGFQATLWGFIAIVVFMSLYYHALRRHLVGRARREPPAAGGAAVAAAGDPDPARHRRHRAHPGHGHRRQRAHQRKDPRGAARRRDAAGGHRRGLRARLGHHPRLQHHHADRRACAAHLRAGAGARLRRGALPGHPHLDVLGGDGVARLRQPALRPPAARRQARHRQHRMEMR